MTSFEIPPLPDPGFYEATYTYGTGGYAYAWHEGEGTLKCTLCPEPDNMLLADVEPPLNDNARKAVRDKVTRHHRDKHPEKLFLLTSAGWTRIEQLPEKTGKILSELLGTMAKTLHN